MRYCAKKHISNSLYPINRVDHNFGGHCIPELHHKGNFNPMLHKPAVVVASKTSFFIGIFECVVRVLKSLIPEQTGFTIMQAGLVLEPSVVLTVGSITL